ncbi:hypothetical protein [Massilia sp. TS11]|uniref:hypothetical protein n=1 Tax=Massilia sp. TS11 TaxID=2908003 RepID=UPI001EDB2841|nr:hypothetical protein [Massilia sp. TS11]MCG2583610.1 hypothetical protein [Massilia sp. TS11]
MGTAFWLAAWLQAAACGDDGGASVRYVSSPAAALYPQPQAEAPGARLPLGTALEVACSQGGWLQVAAPRYPGLQGWLPAANVDEAQPTLGAVLRALDAADPEATALRRRLAAQAEALAPLDPEVLARVLAVEREQGAVGAAAATAARLAQVLTPRVAPLGQPALLALENGLARPLANLGPHGLLPFGGSLEAQLAPARAYRASSGALALVAQLEPAACGVRARLAWPQSDAPPEPLLLSDAAPGTLSPLTLRAAAPAEWEGLTLAMRASALWRKRVRRGQAWWIAAPVGPPWLLALLDEGWLLAQRAPHGGFRIQAGEVRRGPWRLLGALRLAATPLLFVADAQGDHVLAARGAGWQRQALGAHACALSAAN